MNVHALCLKAIEASNKADFATALVYYNKVLELEPTHSITLCNLGALCITAGDFEQAEINFNFVMENDPTYANAYNNMGMLRLTQSRPKEAIPYLQKSVELHPRADIAANIIFAMDMAEGYSIEELFMARKAWAAQYADHLMEGN